MLLRTTTTIVALLASTASAQTPTPASDDAFFEAIRGNNLAKLESLIRSRGVDSMDAQGQTPLMLAAGYGSQTAVRTLLEKGANARAATETGVTALHLGVMNVATVRMLLDAGADVNAASSLGRTPLIVAASAAGTSEAVRMLLARGADVNAADTSGVTPLVAATNVNDTAVAKLLLAHGANPTRVSTAEGISTPLTGAARNGNAELVRLLLAKKVDVNAVGAEHGPTVKNGVIQFGKVTALHMAAVSRSAEVVRLLLAAGAKVDSQDVRGMTPLMFAIATDRPSPEVIRLLIDKGASTSIKSAVGETAADWARKFNHPAVLAALKLPVVTTAAAAPVAVANASLSVTRSPRQAVAGALPPLRAAGVRMAADGGCVACHAQPLVGMAWQAAHARGWAASSSRTESDAILSFVNGRAPAIVQLRDVGGLPDGLLYTALLLATEKRPATRATDTWVHLLAAKQRPEGNWRAIGGTRAPMQDGDISRTALAIRALTAYATPARAAEYRARVTRASAWLARQTLVSTEERVMQLLGLHWSSREPKLRQTRIRELMALQAGDGGWAQTPYLASDAYATGQALYALRELGVAPHDAALQRGVAFLVRTQHEDGSWHVASRAMKVQPYFDSGFPYEHDQWISAAGTAWATMALAAVGLDDVPSQASR